MSSWNYVVTAHKPTIVSHSVVGNFTSPTELNLIIAKCTRIEIHLLTPQGLESIYDVPIYGRITTLELFRPQGESQDLLFLSTERYKFCVLSFDSVSKEIITKSMGDVSDRIGRPTDNGQIGIIDPDCRLIGLHLYDGLFKVIPIDNKGNLKEAFNIRLEELTVLSIKFLYGCAKPTIAVLYEDTRRFRHVKTYEVLLKEKDFAEGPFQQMNLDLGSGLLIPVPAPLGGVIIVGEQVIVYHNGSFFKAIEIRSATTRTYTRIDADGSRYLLNDNFGTLFLLVLTHENFRVTGLKIEELGETSAASSLSYLDNGFVFVGSNLGDSQLIKLNSRPNQDGKFVEVVDSYTNLGPISDFCVVDLEHQGQGQVITCSGAYKDGSLRIIRNGIGINEQANVDLPGIKGMWTLRKTFQSINDHFLVVSFVSETRVLAINEEDELEETEIHGFDSEKQSLYCGNVIHDYIIQVTSSEVRLVNSFHLNFVCNWFPISGFFINVIASNPSQILLATGGGNLVYLEIEEGKIVEKKHTKLEFEISCLDINPIVEGEDTTNLAAIGMWTDFSVRIFSLPNLELLCTEKLSEEVIPRSLLFSSFEGIPYLLCALGDGNLFNFVIKAESGQLLERKKISLGTKPISLRTFRSKNTTHVFAASDRPTVIYSSNKKLLYSNVNVKDVNHICPFNSEAFPDSLAIGKEGQLSIGTIDDIQKLHIKTIPLGETPRRICHHESANAIAVCTVKTTMLAMNEDELETNFLHIYDDQTFECITSFQFDAFETASSIISSSFSDDVNSYIIVGTAFALPEEVEPTKGRILVFSMDNQKLSLVCEKEIKGAVYNLSNFHGKLIAGVNQKVMLYKWTFRIDGSRELQTECGHHGHIVSLFVKTRGDYIVLGDLMKSISLLLYKPQEGAIEERAKDPHANWMTAVEILDDDYFLGAENSFNFFVLHKSNDVTSDDDKSRLEVVGEFHLGDFVNKFQHGSLVMKLPDSEISKMETVLFSASSGMIGVLASLKQEQFAFLFRLQMCLEETVKGVGGFSHKFWRSFSNERKTNEAVNFIDGDLIESFLDLSKPNMEMVAMAMELPVEELCRSIEELTRLH